MWSWFLTVRTVEFCRTVSEFSIGPTVGVLSCNCYHFVISSPLYSTHPTPALARSWRRSAATLISGCIFVVVDEVSVQGAVDWASVVMVNFELSSFLSVYTVSLIGLCLFTYRKPRPILFVGLRVVESDKGTIFLSCFVFLYISSSNTAPLATGTLPLLASMSRGNIVADALTQWLWYDALDW